MTKKFLVLVLVAVVVVAAWFVYKSSKKPEMLASEVAAGLNISEVSLEGEVLTVGKDYAVIRAGRVQRTYQGNVVVMYERVVLFTDAARKESLAKLKVGQTAVFYGTGVDNPIGKEEFTAYKVEILPN